MDKIETIVVHPTYYERPPMQLTEAQQYKLLYEEEQRKNLELNMLLLRVNGELKDLQGIVELLTKALKDSFL